MGAQINGNFKANRDRPVCDATSEPADFCLSMCKLLDSSESMQTGLNSECTSSRVYLMHYPGHDDHVLRLKLFVKLEELLRLHGHGRCLVCHSFTVLTRSKPATVYSAAICDL